MVFLEVAHLPVPLGLVISKLLLHLLLFHLVEVLQLLERSFALLLQIVDFCLSLVIFFLQLLLQILHMLPDSLFSILHHLHALSIQVLVLLKSLRLQRLLFRQQLLQVCNFFVKIADHQLRLQLKFLIPLSQLINLGLQL